MIVKNNMPPFVFKQAMFDQLLMLDTRGKYIQPYPQFGYIFFKTHGRSNDIKFPYCSSEEAYFMSDM